MIFQYTEENTYPKVKEHLNDCEIYLRNPRTNNKFLELYFDCNAFKLQLQEIYLRHARSGTLSQEKEQEITELANKLDKCQKQLEKLP